MDNAKHTPGPWEAVQHTAINNVKGYRIFSGGNEVAVCRNTSGGLGAVAQLPAEANARLIAAAPELLAVLCLALRYMEHPDVLAITKDMALSGEGANDRMRTAIKNATGEKAA